MTPFTSFQTPEAELNARRDSANPRQFATPDAHLHALVSRQFAAQSFPQSLLHHPERDFSRWQSDASRMLRHCLILPDALGHPSSPILIRRDQSHPDFTVEELEITVTPPLRAPATVVIPRNGADRHPAILLLHSMGGFQLYGREKLFARPDDPASLCRYRETYYESQSLQAELARAGFLSIAIDAMNFGQRSPKAQEMGLAGFSRWRTRADESEIQTFQQQVRTGSESFLARSMLALGYSTAALIATDDLRTLDYLISRPDILPDRIACAGLSFGSFRANYLAALDPRVKAAVSVCWLSTLAGVVPRNITGALGFFSLPPGFYRHFDMADIVALAAPKPFLAISGWQDQMIEPSAMAEAHRFFRKVWEQAGAAEHLGSLLYDTGHCFDAAMQNAAIAFLTRHL